MNFKLLVSFLVFYGFLSHFSVANDYDTIRVSDFGAAINNRQNVTPTIIKALGKAKKKKNPLLYFDSGRYDFWPHHAIEKVYYESNTTDINPKRLGILVEGFTKLTIDGNSAEFVFHDRMQPLTVDHSSNVEIRNFTIDWDIPLTAQAEVMEIENDHILLKINKYESPYIIENRQLVFVGEGWKSEITGIMEIERNSRLIAPATGDSGCCGRGWSISVAKEIEPGLVKISKPFGPQRPEVGNFLILRHSRRDHAGMFLSHSRNVSIENVEIYHTAGLGILSQFSEDISINKVKMIPNPKKQRYLSGHDDGFHFSNCKGTIHVTNCTFAALMDDPINIHGTSVKIIDMLEPDKLRCRFMHHQSVGMQWARAGENVGFVSSLTMETVGFGKVKAFMAIDDENFEIAFEQPIPTVIQNGDALENLTWSPDAYIADSKFLSCRARGILVSTPGKVVIERNHFESSGSAILIAGDANNWYESGAVRDVTIQYNVFADPCLTSMYQFSEAIISIYPEIPQSSTTRERYHRNIVIRDNEFHPYDYPILYAKSVDGLEFKNNSLNRSYRFKPFHKRKFTFSLEYCKNVQIADNTFSEDMLGKNILLIGMKKGDLQVSKNQGLSIQRENKNNTAH